MAFDGSILTIRKFAADPYGAEDLVEFGTMTQDRLRLPRRLRPRPTEHRHQRRHRLRQDHHPERACPASSPTTNGSSRSRTPPSSSCTRSTCVRLESRPANIEGKGQIAIRDLVRNALRMRPDRIVVGEVRDAAALDMLQAMNTGHDGSITTVHANSPRDSLARLETMVLMAGLELPVRAIREQVSSAIDLVVHQARLRDGSRRMTHICEVVGMEGDVITLQDLFTFDYRMGIDENGRFTGTLKSTGLRPKFLEKLSDAGITVPMGIFAFEQFSR